MPASKHTTTITNTHPVPVTKAGAEINIKADGKLLGSITIMPACVQWRKPNARTYKRISYNKLAELLEQA